MAKRDTYGYKLKRERRIVGFGITKNPPRRFREHKQSGKRFSHMAVSPYPSSRPTARKREEKSIKRYQRSHGGRKPTYNKRT